MKFDAETWLERAAIYEYDGGITRMLAERLAMSLFADDPTAERERGKWAAQQRGT